MRGLVPRIHVRLAAPDAWMAGTKAGHDGLSARDPTRD